MATVWNSADGFNPTYDFQFELPEPEEKICAAARHFGAWVDTLCHEAEQQRDIVALRQALLLLLFKFFEWHGALPKRHRNYSGKRGHICVFEVFEQGYKRLMLLYLGLEPLLTMPAPAPAQAEYLTLDIRGTPVGRIVKTEKT